MRLVFGYDAASNLESLRPAIPDGDVVTAAPVPVGATVMVVKPHGPFEIGDAVVMDVQPHALPLEGGGLLPTHLYLLQFADGGANWYLRHKFESIKAEQ